MSKLTTSSVESLRGTGQRKSEQISGGGSLVARGLSKTITYTYVYRYDNRKLWQPMGEHSRDGNASGDDAKTYTLVGARKRAQALSVLRDKVGNITAHLKAERQHAELEQKRLDAKQLADELDIAAYSLEMLCTAYWQHLESQRKASAQDTRNALKRWVIKKQPVYAAMKASDISTQDIRVILKTIIAAGHTTTTNRVRSYLLAAYTFGMSSNLNLLADDDATGFGLVTNPVAPIPPVREFEQAGERHLTETELAEFLQRLQALDTPAAKAVILSLRLGAQRIKQLLLVTTVDYDATSQSVILRDGKGRRIQPRIHALPVIDAVKPLLVEGLADRHPQRKGLFGGVHTQTISNLVSGIGNAMAEDNTETFKWQDVRRTAETMLASMGISKDVRAQLQSHGLSGVQNKHYDRHDYLPEKRAALTAWNARLDELISGKPAESNVVAIGAQS